MATGFGGRREQQEKEKLEVHAYYCDRLLSASGSIQLELRVSDRVLEAGQY